MKAIVIIKETSRGFYLEIDNGYGNQLTLTDTLPTIGAAQEALEAFKAVLNNPIIQNK